VQRPLRLERSDKIASNEADSRGELPVSGAENIRLGDDPQAVWSEAT